MYAILHILSGEYFRYYSYAVTEGIESNLYIFTSIQEAEAYLAFWKLHYNNSIISEFINDKSYNYFNEHELQIIKLTKEEIQNAKSKKQ